jgi:hypothetical protein
MADPFATRLQELVPLAASCTSVVDACGVGKGGVVSESGVQGRISANAAEAQCISTPSCLAMGQPRTFVQANPDKPVNTP